MGLEGFRHVCAAAARMCAEWNYLTGIVEICSLETKKCARMVLFDRDEGGGDTGVSWHGMNSQLE